MTQTATATGLDNGGDAVTKTQLWAGRTISGLAVAFFLVDGAMKIAKPAVVLKATRDVLGYPESEIVGIGLTMLLCTLVYVVPRTSVLGAILLTGYLGGAIASHVRIDSPLFTHTLFGLYLGLIVWGGLWLRDGAVRSLLPFRR